jgi:hypothetical protein
MDPIDDQKLSELLKVWQAPNAPASLDARVLGPRRRWWSFLLTGSVRVPLPVTAAITAILVVMAVALVRQRTAAPVSPGINLADFRPMPDLNVRVIRGQNEVR